MSILLQEKRDECARFIKNISAALPAILGVQLNITLKDQDFYEMLKLIRDNYQVISANFQGPFTQKDILNCIKIRHILAHQNTTSIDFLNHARESLSRFQTAFGIQSALVPLRVMACKACGNVITRTAQPTTTFGDLQNLRQRVCRTYDVQVWSVANTVGQTASRENTWYPGWIWTHTYCGNCRSNNRLSLLGFRFDWAPEDRINLTKCEVVYMLERQAMVVRYPDGQIKDLTHVVSDGEVRRHRYAFFERALKEVTDE